MTGTVSCWPFTRQACRALACTGGHLTLSDSESPPFKPRPKLPVCRNSSPSTSFHLAHSSSVSFNSSLVSSRELSQNSSLGEASVLSLSHPYPHPSPCPTQTPWPGCSTVPLARAYLLCSVHLPAFSHGTSTWFRVTVTEGQSSGPHTALLHTWHGFASVTPGLRVRGCPSVLHALSAPCSPSLPPATCLACSFTGKGEAAASSLSAALLSSASLAAQPLPPPRRAA